MSEDPAVTGRFYFGKISFNVHPATWEIGYELSRQLAACDAVHIIIREQVDAPVAPGVHDYNKYYSETNGTITSDE